MTLFRPFPLALEIVDEQFSGNESTKSVRHRLVAYHTLGHKVYLRLSGTRSKNNNDTGHGQNSETIRNCSCRHQAESTWCYFPNGTWMNLELQLVDNHLTHLAPILVDLTPTHNPFPGDHGMRARPHEKHHCWSWSAIYKWCFPSRLQATQWSLPPLTREGVQNSKDRLNCSDQIRTWARLLPSRAKQCSNHTTKMPSILLPHNVCLQRSILDTDKRSCHSHTPEDMFHHFYRASDHMDSNVKYKMTKIKIII